MAATATSPITQARPAAYPSITPETRAELANEWKRLRADPDRAVTPADLTNDATYLFRAKPGTFRKIVHSLPLAPEEAQYETEAKWMFALRNWKRLVAQPAFPDLDRDDAAKAMTARLEAVRDAIGDNRIIFTSIPRKQECYFPTESTVIAEYIRDLIARNVGEFAQVYEASGKARVVVGDKAYPDTETGWRLARSYAAQHGLTDIKLVKE